MSAFSYAGGRQEHHDRPAAEDAFWRQDREDRGRGRRRRRIRRLRRGRLQPLRRPRRRKARGSGVRGTVAKPCSQRTENRRKNRERTTAATGPTPTPGPRRSRCVTSRSSRAIPARSATTARSTRRIGPGCWCGWWARPQWGPRFTNSRSYVGIVRGGVHGPAARGLTGRSMTPRWEA